MCITDYSYVGNKTTHISKRDFSNKNKSKLNKSLNAQRWETIYIADNIRDSFNYFQKQFINMFEECFPEK